MSQIIKTLDSNSIAHGNIRPENILLKFENDKLKDIKLKCFNYSLSYDSLEDIDPISLEYKAPEALKYYIDDSDIK
jgi:serine/threonine protein kinase